MTLFGPGVGECIVLHIGNGDWIVVDSCKAATGQGPAALDYLMSIGVDPQSSVRQICATHWHDDHIRGLATLLRECTQAEFVMSQALATEQFLQLVLKTDAQNKLVSHTSSASEFKEILELLESRANGTGVYSPTFAQDGVRLFQGGFNGTTEVWALSPSAATITNCLTSLADRLMTTGECRRFRRLSANDCSVVLLIQTGHFNFLLGADLENTPVAQFGWEAVVNSAKRPQCQSHVFKIAHHGSQNGDHDAVWLQMLATSPIAAVTPYAKLSDPLPTEADLRRIKNRTTPVYCTTWPVTKKPRHRNGVDGIVRGATRRRKALNTNSGHVRIRVDLSSPSPTPRIELFGGAKEL